MSHKLQMTKRTCEIKKLLTLKKKPVPLSLHLKALNYSLCSVAVNTIKGYISAGRSFLTFLKNNLKKPSAIVDSDILCQFVVHEAEIKKLKMDSLRTKLSCLKKFYEFFQVSMCISDNELENTLKGIESFDFRGKRQAAAIQGSHLELLEKHFMTLTQTDSRRCLSLEQIQVMTLFSVAQNGCFRMSEVLNLKWDQLKFSAIAIEITLSRSKTNQRGGPQLISIVKHEGDHCSAYEWIQLYKTLCPRNEEDWLFPDLSDYSQSIKTRKFNKMVKQYAEVMIMDPSTVSSHSFRAGGATDLVFNGASELDVKRQGRWKSSVMVDNYFRPTNVQFQTKLISLNATRGKFEYGI